MHAPIPRRRSWPMVILFTLGMVFASAAAFEWSANFIFGAVELVAGPVPGEEAETAAEIPWNRWLLLYSAWILGASLAQAMTAISVRWMGAVWIVASCHAGLFGFLFYGMDYTPWMLPMIPIPFWIGYRVTQSDRVLQAIAATKDWEEGKLRGFR